MANVRSGNTWYLDTSDSSLPESNLRLSGLILTATTDSEVVVADDISSASFPERLSVRALANTTVQIRLEDTPVVFSQGIRVKTLTSGAKVTLLLSKPGA